MQNLFRPTEPLGIRESSSAPDEPGLYIWFGKLDIGEADWNSHKAGSNTRASQYLEKALHDHCEKFEKHEISIRAEAHFSTRWHGKLLEDISHRFGRLLVNKDGRPKNTHFERVLSDDANRSLLVRIIQSSFPMFFGPLYIGKATSQSLRQRLSQHSSRFLELWEQKESGESFESQAPTNFAERAFLMGFSPEDLYFSCLPIVPDPGSSWTLSQLEDAIVVAEWLLNRWATPVLGKD
jgi:hypothetical protein